MSWTPTNPVSGGTVTGFTTPTYTMTEDRSSSPHQRRFVITSVGGTQAGVEAHSNLSPFYLTVDRPPAVKSQGAKNALTGVISQVPVNVWRVRLYKGATVATDVERTIVFDLQMRVPAGAEVNDAEELKAAFSFFCGWIYNECQFLYPLVVTNILA